MLLSLGVLELDVETVEALSEALIAYKGTVIFTSHDRYFMRRIATAVVEVRDGRVRNYNGDYESYLYAVNKEVEQGERSRKAQSQAKSGGKAPTKTLSNRDERKVRKEINNVERKIARLDDQKKTLTKQMLETTDADEAMKLHEEIQDVSQQLEDAENRWVELQDEIA